MKFIKINSSDNVAVAIELMNAGESITMGENTLTLKEPIEAGHKFALVDLLQDAQVIKYGFPIGNAGSDISAGEAVHTHNVKTALKDILRYTYDPQLTALTPRTSGTFLGYRRPDGRVGIRNEVWIIPSVGCANGVAQALERSLHGRTFENIDGIYAFPHPYGCSQLAEDHENTKKALCSLIDHPNAGGVLVVGLGCENNTVAGIREFLGDYNEDRVKFPICQESEDEMFKGSSLLEELIAYASKFSREGAPMSELVVGLKCGGSDGFSGITANPLVGVLSDRLIEEGGSAILTEVPEMFGAETILLNRCESQDVFEQMVRLINDFKQYYLYSGQNVYENPSPGNKAGGITTLEDKSLGCVQKGGKSNVVDVLDYGQPLGKKGLSVLTGPGNDLVSASSMAASGAHMVLFTTGRGTPFGCPVPTVKISTNTKLAEKKTSWIDFDAGRLLSGAHMEDLRDELYEYIYALASGTIYAKNELSGYREFTVFKTGVTL